VAFTGEVTNLSHAAVVNGKVSATHGNRGAVSFSTTTGRACQATTFSGSQASWGEGFTDCDGPDAGHLALPRSVNLSIDPKRSGSRRMYSCRRVLQSVCAAYNYNPGPRRNALDEHAGGCLHENPLPQGGRAIAPRVGLLACSSTRCSKDSARSASVSGLARTTRQDSRADDRVSSGYRGNPRLWVSDLAAFARYIENASVRGHGNKSVACGHFSCSFCSS
jgi:hypothetical protein